MSGPYDLASAPEEFYEGTLPDDYSWTDRLAAALAYELHRWRGKEWHTPDLTNARERAHNLRLAAATLIEWAEALEACPAGGPHKFSEHDESPVYGTVVHCEECGALPPDDDPPEPPEYDPGPEVDDEGGMSEFRHADLSPEGWSR